MNYKHYSGTDINLSFFEADMHFSRFRHHGSRLRAKIAQWPCTQLSYACMFPYDISLSCLPNVILEEIATVCEECLSENYSSTNQTSGRLTDSTRFGRYEIVSCYGALASLGYVSGRLPSQPLIRLHRLDNPSPVTYSTPLIDKLKMTESSSRITARGTGNCETDVSTNCRTRLFSAFEQ
ncbi:hypothetical protein CLF_109514 [Clonorchis sinensis]|uniref:Uncharacterized protein n=1 Tax=Clonorchis sinensis TaxID=79923 RepID=G7YSN9_CLOSI|nr:hypothetical protein CLF_109514 [Clonorchis sinensis]